MATPKKAPRTVVTAEWLAAEPDAAADTAFDDLPAANEADLYPDELPAADEAYPFADELPPFTPTDTFDELPALDNAASEAALCPVCGDLLAWHEQACLSVSGSLPTVVPADEEPVVQVQAAATTFAYELGHRVQPTPALPAQIIWRGQLKERHPATGLIYRVNVYRLNDGYWDCYREEELQAA